MEDVQKCWKAYEFDFVAITYEHVRTRNAHFRFNFNFFFFFIEQLFPSKISKFPSKLIPATNSSIKSIRTLQKCFLSSNWHMYNLEYLWSFSGSFYLFIYLLTCYDSMNSIRISKLQCQKLDLLLKWNIFLLEFLCYRLLVIIFYKTQQFITMLSVCIP